MASKFRDAPVKKGPSYIPANCVRFVCKEHNWIVDSLPSSSVWCPCGRKGKREQ